ncbi:MAG: chromate transporter [Victivallales bacterium]|nr:chromate transporter [Victivallales bacterium]
MTLFKLYWIFFKIGFFTYGGGYAMIPLIQEELVRRHELISAADFGNIMALAQITPGPIGINAATYIGYQYGGVFGALVGTTGLMVPSLIIVSLVVHFVRAFEGSNAVKGALSGIRPAVLGMIAAAVLFFAEMSVFTGPLPLAHWLPWLTESKAAAASFGVSWQGAVVFLFALIAVGKYKWRTSWVLIASAGLGALLFLW